MCLLYSTECHTPHMSHDPIELRRLVSANASVHSRDSANMSATGNSSFTGEMSGGALPDVSQNPMYSSIPEAQNSHLQYRASQLKQQVRGE